MAKMSQDMGKTARKVLDEDYSQERRVKIVSSVAAGENITLDASANAKGVYTNVLGYKMMLRGFEVVGSLLSEGSAKVSVVADQFVDGLKLSALGGYSAWTGASGKTSAIYRHQHVASSIEMEASEGEGLAARGESAIIYEGFSLGVSSGYDMRAGRQESRATLCYTDGEESEVSVSACDKPLSLRGTYYHRLSHNLRVAVQGDYDAETSARVATMGTMLNIDEYSIFKAKFSSVGLVSASFVQQVNPGLRVALSTSINVTELENGHRFGINLQFEAPVDGKEG